MAEVLAIWPTAQIGLVLLVFYLLAPVPIEGLYSLQSVSSATHATNRERYFTDESSGLV